MSRLREIASQLLNPPSIREEILEHFPHINERILEAMEAAPHHQKKFSFKSEKNNCAP